jgi:amino acid adenylation domain-containing protein
MTAQSGVHARPPARVERLIFEQAARTPDATAVVDGCRTLSYAGLTAHARAIGASLRRMGVGPGVLVGLWMERDARAVAAMIGIWEAGGVAVPLALDAPAAVLEQIVTGDGIRTLVVSDGMLDSSPAAAVLGRACPVSLTIDADGCPVAPASVRVSPVLSPGDEDGCYIYYTSGSRGRPKGVEGLHSSLVQYLRWQAREFAVGPGDRFSQVAPLTFDFCLKEIFVPLISGASVHIADNATVRDPEAFLEWAGRQGITTLCCVPSLFRSLTRTAEARPDLLRHLQADVRDLLVSGDLLRWEDVRAWRRMAGDRPALVNLYGPTESTVIKLFYRIPPAQPPDSRSVPVGQPIAGAEVWILDERGQPCSGGEIGEIVILSDWIARGYRGDVSERGDAFTTIETGGVPVRAYRTGDLGRRLADGTVEIAGRRDRQVKVRGHRVELDAVEAALAAAPGVADVAVVVTGEDDARTIVCFFVAGDETSVMASARAPAVTPADDIRSEVVPAPDAASLRAYAAERLLPGMVPGRFVRLPALPLSANGKVDRLALAAGSYVTAGTPDDGLPATDLERRVIAIWRDILLLDEVGREDGFFELGGNSITAIMLLGRLRREVHQAIDLGDLFLHPTVADFCAWVSGLPGAVEQVAAGISGSAP